MLATRQLIKQNVCTNCGNIGHHYKHCMEPVISYGIIAFHIQDPSWDQAERLARNELTGIPEDKLEFLMIERRDSIGYVEIIRAKYRLTDIDHIREQISGTTADERNALHTKSFDDLWVGLWGPMNQSDNRQYRQEYEQAKVKFEQLCAGVEVNGELITLKHLLNTTPLLWNTPEWGFPKGRRNIFESDLKCAMREFCEETGLQSTDIRIFENIKPIRETFIGNNNIHYSHVYYLAWVPRNVQVKLRHENELMNREVGNIGWFSLEKALNTIRHTNVEKREILLRTSLLLRNLCPLFVGPLVSVAEQRAEQEGAILYRNRGNESSATRTTNPWFRTRNIPQTPFSSEEYGFITETD
jgi:8-oxo-dGTP pyrophosphatase MutT (NUDIX family)